MAEFLPILLSKSKFTDSSQAPILLSTESYVKFNSWQQFNIVSQSVLLLLKSEDKILRFDRTWYKWSYLDRYYWHVLTSFGKKDKKRQDVCECVCVYIKGKKSRTVYVGLVDITGENNSYNVTLVHQMFSITFEFYLQIIKRILIKQICR